MSDTDESQIVDPREFRAALGAFPTGVTIMTARGNDGSDVGMTASSFNSVSLDPPLILWSVAKTAGAGAVFTQATHFAAHILSADQEALAARFAAKGVDRFAGVDVSRGPSDVPLLDGCAARFVCKTAHQYEGGDHVIIVGEVLSLERFDRPSLAFQSGSFALALKRGATAPAPLGGEDGVDANAVNMLVGVAHAYLGQRIKPHLDSRGLSEVEYWILSIAGAKEGRAASRFGEILAPSGLNVGAAQIERLRDLGYVEIKDGPNGGTLWLTSLGRRQLVELAAVSRSVEEALESDLDYAEAQLLWELLRRLIVSMIPAQDP